MPKKSGWIFIAAGVVLISSALLLFAYNGWESHRAGQASERLMLELEKVLDDNTEETIPEETLDPELPVVTIDGHDYVGYLEFWDLELKLPVQAQWSYPNLQISPCRESGSSRVEDLIIAAHNYSTHFGKLKTLPIGSVVTFTDMDGIENFYAIAEIITLDPTKSEVVYGSAYPLVLYTCTPGGETRVVAFCERITEAEALEYSERPTFK